MLENNNFTCDSDKNEGEHKSMRINSPDNIDIEQLKLRRKEIKENAKSMRNEEPIVHKGSNISITITGFGIDEFLNQPHKHYAEKNEMLLNIRSIIERSKYIGVSIHKSRIAHIFETELCDEKTWIIATEVKGRGISLYSISDSSKILKYIIKIHLKLVPGTTVQGNISNGFRRKNTTKINTTPNNF